MFVRFRQSRRRLQVSLVATRREAGKVRVEHIAGLGAVDLPPTVRSRRKFWAELHGRLARLSNRVNGDDLAKVYGSIHARIPMVTAAEQRALQEETAKAEERFWSTLRDMHAETIDGQERLSGLAEQTAATVREFKAVAEAHVTTAKERLEKLGRGEDVPGGFDAPLTRKDVLKILQANGWNESDIRRAELTHEIAEAGGFEDLLAEIEKRHAAAEKSARRSVAKRLRLL